MISTKDLRAGFVIDRITFRAKGDVYVVGPRGEENDVSWQRQVYTTKFNNLLLGKSYNFGRLLLGLICYVPLL